MSEERVRSLLSPLASEEVELPALGREKMSRK